MTYFNTSIDHINLTVPNMQKVLSFYTNTMGFKIVNKFKGKTEFVFITDGTVTYELMEDTSVSETVIDHIAYKSENIKADFEHFSKLGLTICDIGYADFLFDNGVYYFFIKSEDNVRIEFIQKKSAHN